MYCSAKYDWTTPIFIITFCVIKKLDSRMNIRFADRKLEKECKTMRGYLSASMASNAPSSLPGDLRFFARPRVWLI
jgi:hypothetical protein